ncbi:MAG: baseplate J/gp47 family protein [Oscillospiraceae bacterium]
MLPIPSLDDERFREIVENARRMIPRFYPEWTDFNYHDPGITFLELFAFLKESQQYHLDQIGPRNRQKYLKLLGMEQAHRAPARLRVTLSGRDLEIPRGTRLFADEIPFETERRIQLPGSKLCLGYGWDGEKKSVFTTDAYAQEGKLRVEIFGRSPTPDAALYLGFDGALPQTIRLFIQVSEDCPVGRNPVGDGIFSPLAEVTWEYQSAEGWRSLTVLRDETQAFLFGGETVLQSDGGAALPDGDGNCWIRARFAAGSYDIPPVLTGISDETVVAVQRETDAECLLLAVQAEESGQGLLWDDGLLAATGDFALALTGEDGFWHMQTAVTRAYCPAEGRTAFAFPLPSQDVENALLLTWRPGFAAQRCLAEGTGFPGQTALLAQRGQLYDSFELLVEEPGQPGAWSIWKKVADFDGSGPEDCHFVLDEETGGLCFGDCVHGRAPEGEIRIAAQGRTLAEAGNIKAGQLRAIHPADAGLILDGHGGTDEEIRVRNYDNAAGGQSRESEEACFLRCRRLLRQSERAVTYADYERLVRKTPGLRIANCKAVPVTKLPRQDGSLAENCVTVVVEPYADNHLLSPAYVENILHHLENRRMLGTKVSVLAPEYVGITVYAEILTRPHYMDAKERIRAAVEAFFGGGWEFGRPVQYSSLYGSIDTLDCVAGIESLTIDAQGKGITRGIGGDVILPYNGLAVLRNASYQVRPAE